MLDIKIVQLDCDTTNEAYPMCVAAIHYVIIKTDGEHTASKYGTIGVPLDEEAEYTAFEELTEEQVKGWLDLDLVAIEAQLDAELTEKSTPKSVSVASPFESAEPVA